MSTPTLSVIIPTLNEAATMPHLLEDLVNQTDQVFEVILVDANSDDDTIRNARSFSPKLPQFKILQSQLRNVSHQRNLGAKVAQEPWLMFCDADNRLPTHFITGIKYRIALNEAQAFTTCANSDSSSYPDRTAVNLINSYLLLHKDSTKPFSQEGLLIFETKRFHRLGGFDPNIHVGEGQELIKKLVAQNGKYTVYKDPRYTYSLRRLRQLGYLPSAKNAAEIEIKRLLNISLNPQEQQQLYPMQYQTKPPQTIHQLAAKLPSLVKHLKNR